MRSIRLGLLTVLSATIGVVGWGCGHKSKASVPGPSGSLDGGFGTGGSVIFPTGVDGGIIVDLFVRKDGTIVAVGGYSDPADLKLAAGRFDADGTPDPSFGTGGLAVADLPPAAYFDGDVFFSRAAMQDDGKIVVAGGTSGEVFSLFRFDTDGANDPTFGANGLLQLRTAGPNGEAHAVAVQPDGKIVAAGPVTTTAGVLAIGVIRVDANGAVDPTFGNGGVTLLPAGSLIDLALQSDGKIVLSGATVGQTEQPMLTRLEPNGTLDAGFGSGGQLLGAPDGSEWWAVKTDSMGRLLTAGIRSSSTSGQLTAIAARFLSDGSPDPSFGDGGAAAFSNGSVEQLVDIAVDPTDDVVFGGDVCLPSGCGGLLVRYLASGAPDATFGTDGALTLHPIGPNDESGLQAVAIDARGRILAGGAAFDSGFQWSLSRLWP